MPSASPAVPTTASAALDEFYINTYVAGAKYLPASELIAEKTINGISTTFRQIAQKAEFCRGAIPPRVTGGDTDASITALMNAATRTMISSLISAYSTTHDTWTSRGITITKATTADPSDVALTSAILTVRNNYIGSGGHWPTLLTAIQTVVKTNRITSAKTGYGLLTGSPVGPGKLALTSKPIVQTLMNANATLVGSHTGATSFGFFWSTSSMGTGVTGGTLVAGTAMTTGTGFTAALTGLTAGTTYYYKAWATNGAGTTYGVERTFVHAVAPTLGALTITRSPTALTITGTITNGGGARIIEKGIAWAITAPANWITGLNTMTTRTIEVAGDTTSWTSVISGLTAGTNYSFVGYARNSIGVSISAETIDMIPLFRSSVTLSVISKTVTSIVVGWTNPNSAYTVNRISIECVNQSSITSPSLTSPYTISSLSANTSYTINITIYYNDNLTATGTITDRTNDYLYVRWGGSSTDTATHNTATSTSITKRYIIYNLPDSANITLQKLTGNNVKTNISGIPTIITRADGSKLFEQSNIQLATGCDIGYFFLNINMGSASSDYIYYVPYDTYSQSICSYLKGGFNINKFSYDFIKPSESSNDRALKFFLSFGQNTSTITSIEFNFDVRANSQTYSGRTVTVSNSNLLNYPSYNYVESSTPNYNYVFITPNAYLTSYPEYVAFNYIKLTTNAATNNTITFTFDKYLDYGVKSS